MVSNFEFSDGPILLLIEAESDEANGRIQHDSKVQVLEIVENKSIQVCEKSLINCDY